MHVPYAVYKLWIITTRMSTAIAYSFMTMDNNRRDNAAEQPRTPRRNNSNDRFKNNINFDTVSESGTMTKSGSSKRRPRKRSTSGSRSKQPKVSTVFYPISASSKRHCRIAYVDPDQMPQNSESDQGLHFLR